MKRRIMSLILAIAMIVTMIPQTAFAENTGNESEGYLAYRYANYNEETGRYEPELEWDLQTTYESEASGGVEIALYFVDWDGNETPVYANEVVSSDESIFELNMSQEEGDVVFPNCLRPGNAQIQYVRNGVTYSVDVISTLPQFGFYSTPYASADSFIRDFYVSEDNKTFYLVSRDGYQFSYFEECPLESFTDVTLSEDKTYVKFEITDTFAHDSWYGAYGYAVDPETNDEQYYTANIHLLDLRPKLVLRDVEWEDYGPVENQYFELFYELNANKGDSFEKYIYFEENGELTMLEASDLYVSDESFLAIRENEYANLISFEVLRYGEGSLCYEKDDKVYCFNVKANIPNCGFSSSPEYSIDTYITEYTVNDGQHTFYYAAEEGYTFDSFKLEEEFDEIADYTIAENGKYVEIQIIGNPYHNAEYLVTGTMSYRGDEWGEFAHVITLYNGQPGLRYKYADWSENGYWNNPEMDSYERWQAIPGESGVISFYYFENGIETPVAFQELYVADDRVVKISSDGYDQGLVDIEAIREGDTEICYDKDGVTYSVDVDIFLPRVGFYSKPEISGDNYLQKLTVTEDNNTVYLLAKDGWKFMGIEEMDGEAAEYVTATISEDETCVTIQFSEDVKDSDFYISCRIYNSQDEEECSANQIRIENGKPALTYKHVTYDGSEYVEYDDIYYKDLDMSYNAWKTVHFYFKDGDEARLLETSEVTSADDSIVTITGDNENEYVAEIETVGVGETEFLYTYEGVTYTLPVTVPFPWVGTYSSPDAAADEIIDEFMLTEDSKEFYVVAKDGCEITNIVLEDEFSSCARTEINEDRTCAKVILSEEIEDARYRIYVEYSNAEQEWDSENWLHVDVVNGLPGLKYGYAWLEDGEIMENEDDLSNSWYVYPNIEESVVFYYCENGVQTKVKSSELTIKNDDIVTLSPMNGDEYAVYMLSANAGETTISYTINGKTYDVTVKVELPEIGFYSSPTASAETYIESFMYYGEDDTFFLVPINGYTLEDVRLYEEYGDLVEVTVDPLANAFAAFTIKDSKFEDIYYFVSCDAVNKETGETLSDWGSGIYLENGNPDLKFHHGIYNDDGPIEMYDSPYKNTMWGCKGDENFVYLYCVEKGEGTRVTYDQVTSSDESIVKVKAFERDPNATMLEIVGFGEATIDYVLDGEVCSMKVCSELEYQGFFSEPVFSEETFIADFTLTDENDTFYYILDDSDVVFTDIRFEDGLAGNAEGRIIADNIAEIKVTGTPRDGEWGGVVIATTYPEYSYSSEQRYGLNLYNGKAALKYHWGEYDENGLFENVNDSFGNRWYTQPGNSAVMYFYMVSGDSQERVTYDQLTSSNEDVVRVVREEADSNATRLEVVGFGEATINYTLDGTTYSIDIVSELPDVGFYSELDSWASEETFITEFTVTDENKSFYIIPKQGYYIQNPLLSSDFFEIAELYVDARGYARVDIIGVPQDGRYYDVFFEVGNMENPNEVREGHRGIRLFNGMPALKYHWGEWDETGNLFERDDEEMQGFWQTAPGNSSVMYFYTVKDGNADRAIFEQLTSTNEDVVIIREENRDSRAVRLEVVGFGSAEIQCTIDGVTYSMPVESTLPGVGFYSSPAASKNTYINEFEYTEDNNKFYLVSNGEFIISNPVVQGELADLATVELDESGLFATITLNGTPQDNQWIELQYGVTNVNHPGDTWMNGRGIRVKNNMPSLKFNWGEWNNDNLFENTNDGMQGFWRGVPGDSPTMYFYTVKDGEAQRAIFKQLTSTNEDVVVIREENRDSRAVRLDIVGFGKAEIQCTIDGVTYSMPVESTLPEAGFYSAPEASEETFLKEFGYTEDNNKFYLVSNGEFIISNPVVGGDFSDLATVELDESGLFATITITGTPEEGNWLHMEYGITNVNHPGGTRINGRGIDIINNMPALKYRWADWDENDNMYENPEYRLEGSWNAAPGDSSPMYFYIVKDGKETRVTYNMLESTDENVVIVTREREDSRAARLEMVGFGQAEIRCTVDGETYSMPVTSCLPQTGFYTTSTASEETYIREFNLTEENNKFYLVSNGDVRISLPMNASGLYEIAQVTLDSSGMFAEIEITGTPEDGRWYDMEIGVTNVNDPEDSWMNGRSILINNHLPGLKYRWADYDDGYMKENTEYPLESTWYTNPGVRSDLYVYYVKDGVETRIQASQLTSSDERVVVIREADDPNGVVLETVGFGEARIDYFVDGKMYSIPVVSELPGFGFYSANEVSEETYITEYMITEDTSVIYLLAKDDYVMSDVVLDEEFAAFAEAEIYKDGTGAKIIITGEPLWDGGYGVHFFGSHVDFPEDSWEGGAQIQLIDRKPGLRWIWSDVDVEEGNVPFEKELWAAPGEAHEVFMYYINGVEEVKLSIDDVKSTNEDVVKVVEAENGAVVIEFVGFGEAQIVYTDANGKEYGIKLYSELSAFGFYDECEATEENWLAGKVEITDDDNVFYFMGIYDLLVEKVELSDEVAEYATVEVDEAGKFAKITIDKEFEADFFEMYVEISDGEEFGDSTTVGIELINVKSSLEFCWPDETGAASEEFFNTLYTAYGYDEYAYIYHVVGDGATMLSIEDLKVSDDSIIKLEEAENGMIKVSALGWGEVEISYTVGGKTYSCVVDSYVPEVGYFDEPVKDKENWIPNTITITDDDNVFYFMTTEGIVIDRIEFNSDVEDFATMEVSEDRTLATITIDGDFDGAYFELSYDLSHPSGWSRSSTHGTFLVDGRTPEQPDEPFVPVVPDGVDYAPYYDAATGTIQGIKVGDEVEVGTVFSGNNLEEGQMLAFGYKAYDTDVIFGYTMLFDRGLYTVGEEDGNFDPADGWVVGSVHYNGMEDMLVISMVSKVPPVQINPINISVDWSKLKEFKVGEQVPEQVEAVSITGEGVARVWPADVLFAVREEHIDKGYITDEEYHNAILENSGWWYVRWVDDEFIASAGDEFAVRVDASSEIGYVFAYSQSEQITGNIVLYTSDIVVLSAGSYVGDYAGMAADFNIKLGSIEKISEKANPVVKLTGWQLIDGKWYFYDNEGQRVTNQWRKDSKGWCFLGEDGAMLTNQWVKDSVGYCFVDESGYMVYNQWCEDANGLAYAGSDGYRQTSKWIQDSKGWSYVDETGYKVYNEWVSDCYIDDTGYMAANKWIETDDGFLYMGANGYKTTNKWVQRAGKWCYLGANGYAVTNQWMKDSKGWCYLDDRGFMVYDQWIADSKGLCYVGSNGYMATNQWVETAEGKVYVGGSGYKVTNGWVKDSNGMCYLGEDGLQVYDQWVTDDNGACYIGSNGYVSKDMWIQTDDGWCYVGSDGYRVANKWLKKVGNWAYVGADGYMVTNDWAKDGSRWCYMDDKGFMTKDQWINDGTGSCYMDANGYLVTNKWLMVDGEWVYVGNSGYMVVNAWAKDSKGWCYLDENGHMVYNDWVADSKGEVYLDASGYMVTNKWIAIGDEWCYVGSDGYKVTNQWRKDSAGWCYLGEDGLMLRNQWVKDSVGYCYVDGSGYMVYSQWVDIEEDRYYVNSSGYRATGWLQLEGKWYYFKEDGVMARDEMIGSDYVDENGVWVK